MAEPGLGCLEASEDEITQIDLACGSVGDLGDDIPNTLDARSWLRVNNQGPINSCCGNAVDKALEWSRWVSLHARVHPEDLSARFSYLAALTWAKTIQRGDNGVSIEAGVMAARDLGTVEESVFPYWRTGFTSDLPREIIDAAGVHRVRSVARVQTADDVIRALGNGVGATVFGMYWTSAMSGYGGGVIDQMPGGRSLGGHAVCAVDYDKARGLVWVANSHGERWGDRGWFCVTCEVLDGLLQQPFGSFTVSGIQGFQPRQYAFAGFMS